MEPLERPTHPLRTPRMYWTDIIEEHVDEAAFLFEQRRGAFASRLYDLERLAEHDERLLANLDGLMLAGDEGWKASIAGLESKNDGPAFVAGYVALASGEAARIETLAKAMADPKAIEGLSAALRLADGAGVIPALEKLAAGDPLGPRALALEALAARGRKVEPRAVQALLDSGKSAVVLAGLAIAGRASMTSLGPAVARAFLHPHPWVALGALRAGLRLELPEALPTLRARAAADDGAGAAAIRLLGLAGEREDVKPLLGAARSAARGRAALLALGRLGAFAAADTLVAATADEKLGSVAGHALSTLLGVDLAAEGLVAPAKPAPAGAEEAFALDPDEDLPKPDPEKVRAWWSEQSKKLDREPRLRRGQPFTWEVVVAEARDGVLPDRDQALQEIALRLPAASFVERRDWASRQREAVESLAGSVADAARGAAPGSWTTALAHAGRR